MYRFSTKNTIRIRVIAQGNAQYSYRNIRKHNIGMQRSRLQKPIDFVWFTDATVSVSVQGNRIGFPQNQCKTLHSSH